MAPEVVMGDAYNEKADVFSFGVVCCELITSTNGDTFRRLIQEG